MSLLFADSFDGVIAGGAKWDDWNTDNEIHSDYGRNGTKGMLVTDRSASPIVAFKSLAPSTNRVTAGAWVYCHNPSGGPGTNDEVFRFDSGDGSVVVTWGASLTRFQLSGSGLATQEIGSAGTGQRLTWIFLELMWEPGVAVEVRANGASLFSGTPGGSGTPHSFRIRRQSLRWRVEDLYIIDSSGTVNSFLGPIKIANLKPDGAGSRTELTPEPSGNNWERVSDGSDATYVEGDPGDGDLYTFGDLPSSDDIHGVVQFWRGYDPAGTITGRAISRVGSTEYDGDDKAMPGSAFTHIQPWDVSPDTGQPWTPAEVDGAEFGVEFA